MIPTKRHNFYNNRKKIIMIVAGALALLVIAAIALWIVMGSDEKGADINDASVSEEKASGEKETKLSSEDGKVTDDNITDTESTESYGEMEQEYYVDFVDLAVLYNGDGVFDIHIRFPNGEDYVVVAGKSITDKTDDGFYIMLNDRENHMLSSAKTDSDVYVGTQLYLSRYESESAKETIPNYPWNQYVLGAHGLEDEVAEDIYARRIQLEENLATFMNQTLNK